MEEEEFATGEEGRITGVWRLTVVDIVNVCVGFVVTFGFLHSSPGTGGNGFLETRKEEQKRAEL